MSTDVNIRSAFRLMTAPSLCLALLLPDPANAQSRFPEQNGIVIPIPLPEAAPSPQAVATSSKAPRPLKALSRPHPTIAYTSLPAGDRVALPDTTGSLPGSGPLGGRVPSGFASLISRGAIEIRDTAPADCLPGNLLAVVADIAGTFGAVSIESTHRSTSRNRRAGGARHSLHLSCRALDFRVKARGRGIMAYLRSRPEVGGLKMYRNGIIHIDNGERRSW
ncbi:D-Ala-D-Ala carboxypeptidase family metallohydrolase [Microvirga sp. M2]|uniref:D-Ala-D-Ala carboxypeptidase family metallohydrolase n=1 Tax=Microvirga sp. M2 TaxID=3073270 RepID=UPI0039C47778